MKKRYIVLGLLALEALMLPFAGHTFYKSGITVTFARSLKRRSARSMLNFRQNPVSVALSFLPMLPLLLARKIWLAP